MQTWEQTFEDFEAKFWAQSGLGRLDPYPDENLDHTFLPNGIETCNNENGILFLAFTLVHAYRSGTTSERNLVLSYRPRIAAIIDSLRAIEGQDGLYNRQPWRPTTRTEAHDNYVGIVALCALYGLKVPVKAIVAWGWTHWFSYNNVNPDKFEWAQFRQPGDLAFYHAVEGTPAPLLFSMWLWVGLLIATYDYQEVGAGRTQLPWLRLWAMAHVGGPTGYKTWAIHKLVSAFWMYRLRKNWGGIGNVHHHYMKPTHPIHGFTALAEAKGQFT